MSCTEPFRGFKQRYICVIDYLNMSAHIDFTEGIIVMLQRRWMGKGMKHCSVWLFHAPLPGTILCSELGSQFWCTVSLENSIRICCLETAWFITYKMRRQVKKKKKSHCSKSRVAHLSTHCSKSQNYFWDKRVKPGSSYSIV